jgi:hypothetical protein
MLGRFQREARVGGRRFDATIFMIAARWPATMRPMTHRSAAMFLPERTAIRRTAFFGRERSAAESPVRVVSEADAPRPYPPNLP